MTTCYFAQIPKVERGRDLRKKGKMAWRERRGRKRKRECGEDRKEGSGMDKEVGWYVKSIYRDGNEKEGTEKGYMEWDMIIDS